MVGRQRRLVSTTTQPRMFMRREAEEKEEDTAAATTNWKSPFKIGKVRHSLQNLNSVVTLKLFRCLMSYLFATCPQLYFFLIFAQLVLKHYLSMPTYVVYVPLTILARDDKLSLVFAWIDRS